LVRGLGNCTVGLATSLAWCSCHLLASRR
jgi:hypothetical protein